MKILDKRWFCGRTNVGIVQVEDLCEGIKYYISAITHLSTEEADARFIADWGNTFPKDVGDMLFGVNVLNDLQDGRAVVIPKDAEHAEAMVRVGMFYLEQHGKTN